MKIYNSMTNQKETFVPITPGEVKMYVCGPTVYNYIHIGNARPLVVFDTLRRVLERLNYKVTYVSNYTDVDDKIINAAKELGVSEQEITTKFIEAYNEDRRRLNVIQPEYTPKVTEYMQPIIDFIQLLIEKGYAYQVNGDVYFRVSKIEDYGRLSNRLLEDMKIGARIEANLEKENPLDFTLWKATSEGINWEAPFSKGRPGWHTECVVMIGEIFKGQLIDIHGGGMDLKFPHHENEIAQAKGCFNHSLANYWMHNGFINMDNEKMSKSLGNVLWAKDVVEKIGGNVFRLLVLSTHYRAPLNFTQEVVDTTTKEMVKIETALKQANLALQLKQFKSDKLNQVMIDQYLEALSDDLNTSNAIALVFEMVKKLNSLVRTKEVDLEMLSEAFNTTIDMLNVLGIKVDLIELTPEQIELYTKWNELKAVKDFAQADVVRGQLIEQGII